MAALVAAIHTRAPHPAATPSLVPGIRPSMRSHSLRTDPAKKMDARNKCGHDDVGERVGRKNTP